MADKQIVQFILHRAAKNCKHLHISDPKLLIVKGPTSSLYLGVQFDVLSAFFFIRFTNGSKRGLFNINPADDGFKTWKESLIKAHGNIFQVEYDLDMLPAYVKHYVSYAFIQALKTKEMGFDLFSAAFHDDIMLVSPNETYEEASIEIDLMDFELDAP